MGRIEQLRVEDQGKGIPEMARGFGELGAFMAATGSKDDSTPVKTCSVS